ncbi:MAG: hypothetical protein BalsKO_06210 [Balneolaceae bacterium]
MEQVLVDYLKYLNISVSDEYVKKIILSHPDYPSLLSISDALERLGVPSQIGRIEEEHLYKVEFPVLIHLKSTNEGFLLVKSKDDLSKKHVNLKEWKGVVLKAESVKKIKDTEHNKVYEKERFSKKIKLVLTVSLLGALLIPTLHSFSWINLILLTTAMIGSILGYILIAKELGITYKPVESFCNTSTLTNCDKVLNSEGGKVFSFFSLSEAVVSYFVFQLILTGILLPFLSTITPYLWVLILGSALSIPVIAYSVYYQSAIAKTWCKLCMLVNVVLVAQAVVFGFLFYTGIILAQDIELVPFIFLSFLLVTISASVILIKEQFQITDKAVNAEIAASRLKNDPEVFTSLLMQGAKVDTGVFDKRMIIGNPNASIQLIMIASLHCYPCKLAFEHVHALVDNYSNQIGVELRFTLSKDMIYGIPATTYLINQWEQSIYGLKEESMNTKRLIQEWYDHMSLSEFEKMYPKEQTWSVKKEHGLELQHYQWIIKHEISRTPTFLLNNYPFPLKYSIEDLDNLMMGLEELLIERKKEQVTQTKELVE